MKRILSLCLIIAVLFCCTISSYATEIDVGLSEDTIWVDDGNGNLKVEPKEKEYKYEAITDNVSFYTSGMFDENTVYNEGILQGNSIYDNKYFKRLQSIGVFEEIDITEEIANNVVSRGKFVELIISLVKLPVTAESKELFADVPSTHSSCKAVYAAKAYGIVKGSGVLFEPDRNISYVDAATMLVRLLGREKSALSSGGYPTGYYSTASSMDLLDGVKANASDNLSFDNLCQMLWNTLVTNKLAVITSYSASGNTYTFNSDQSLLENLWHISIVEGTVSTVGMSSIFSTVGGKEDEVVIDSVKFEGRYEDYINLLGLDVYALYYIDKLDRKVLLSADEINNDIIVIDADDVDSFSNNVYTYYVNNKRKTIRINDSTSILYNGRLLSGKFQNYMIPENGSVTLISNNSSGISTVKIESYSDFVIGAYDKENNKLYDYYNSQIIYDLEKAFEDGIITVADGDGSETFLSMISRGTVVSLASSQDNMIIKIIINDKLISGKIESISEDGDRKFIEINGQKYELTAYAESNNNNLLILGNTISCGLNSNGKVVFITTGGSVGSDFNFGYLIRYGLYDSAFDSKLQIKMLNSSKEIKVYDVSPKCKIDGKSYKKSEDQENAIISGFGADMHVFSYKLNDENELINIDTPTVSSYESELSSLVCIHNEPGVAYRYKGSGNYGYKVWLQANSDTMFINVTAASNEDDKYLLRTPNSFLKNDNDYILKAYSIGGGYTAMIAETDISSVSSAPGNKKYNVVTRILVVMDENEGEMYKLETHWGKGESAVRMTTEEFESLTDPNDGEKLEEGDIVVFDSVEGKLTGGAIRKVYDYSKDECYNPSTEQPSFVPIIANDNIANGFQIGIGYVYDVKGQQFAFYKTNDVNELDNPDMDNMKICDFTYEPGVLWCKYSVGRRGSVEVSVASVAQLNSFNAVGENASRCLIREGYMQPEQIVIIERE